ncbi:MAG TPA: PQQ-binding-like beta-propeller repeat protein, partial [Bacteroidales bacterium]|nr:PQQ-binding-like beta-propeller repeat protein [Bacteroidales bacterium]
MKDKSKIKVLSVWGFLMLIPVFAFPQEMNWTHFRGTNLNGISTASGIPAEWNESVIKWKTSIHGNGHSSPVVYNDQVWITTATSDGSELYAVCVDLQTGKIIHDLKVFDVTDQIGKHGINTYASPTPCIESGFVYVHFGSLGTACLRTTDGSVVWKRTDLKCNHVQGPGSSPILYKNLLILHYEGTDVRYIVALNKATGKEVWRANRPEEPYKALANIGKKAYVTPLVMNVKGKDLLISNGSAVCCAYDPLTGKEVWRVIGGAESTVPMPFAWNGKVFFYTGSVNNPGGGTYTEMFAVDPDGKGDITSTNILWKKRDDQTHTQMLTPVAMDGLIYTVTTRNYMMCIDAGSGKELWSQRLRSDHNASPVIA